VPAAAAEGGIPTKKRGVRRPAGQARGRFAALRWCSFAFVGVRLRSFRFVRVRFASLVFVCARSASPGFDKFRFIFVQQQLVPADMGLTVPAGKRRLNIQRKG
jgi:hypothetical protein